MRWIHQQDLEIHEGGVFSNPVGVEDSEGSTVTTDTFFSNRLESSSGLNKETHVNGFTHGSSLGYWLLSSTTSNSDSVYNKSLSCFVTQSSSLSGRVGREARWMAFKFRYCQTRI